MRRIKNKRKTATFVRVFIISAASSLVIFFLLTGFYMLQFFSQSQNFISPLSKSFVKGGTTADVNTLEKLLKEKNIAFSFLSPVDDASYLVSLTSGEEIVFSAHKPLSVQVSSLQLIVSRLTIEGKRIGRLDFRYDKPVIILR